MGMVRGQTPPFRAPLAQPWDPGWDPITGFLDRPAPEGAPQVERVECFGPVRAPKRKSDEMKMRDFLNICRAGNIREARAIVQHTPQLLAYTDKYGLTALHHAQMSQKAEFFAEFLQIYHEPRFFQRKFVRYESAQELREESLCLMRPSEDSSATRPPPPPAAHGRGPAKPPPVVPLPPGPIIVRQFAKGSRACWEGVVAGDTLEGIYSDHPRSRNFRKIAREVCDTADGAGKMEDCFPLALEFRGPACREILRQCGAALSHVAKSRPSPVSHGKCIPVPVLRAQQRREGSPVSTGCRPPRRVRPAEHGAGVLPTLLVREEQMQLSLPSITKRANQWWSHPMKPIVEARVAAGRAAARVSAARAAAAQAAAAHVEERKLPTIEVSHSAPELLAIHRYGEAPERYNNKLHHSRHYLPEEVMLPY